MTTKAISTTSNAHAKPQGKITPSNQSKPRARVLKVEEIGNFYRNRTKPQIRLKGKWLAEAGLKPNRHVQVSNPSPGVLVLYLMDDDAR